jgi:hypothetical protein
MKDKMNKIFVSVLFVALIFTAIYQHRIITNMSGDVVYVRDEVNYNVIGHIRDMDLTLRVMMEQQRKEIDAELERIRATEELNFETLSFNKEEILMRIDSVLMEVSDIYTHRGLEDNILRMEVESLREYVQERHLAYDALLEKTSALENILEDLREPLLKTWREKLEVLDSISNELKAIGDPQTQ